jgi:hypothetical protein
MSEGSLIELGPLSGSSASQTEQPSEGQAGLSTGPSGSSGSSSPTEQKPLPFYKTTRGQVAIAAAIFLVLFLLYLTSRPKTNAPSPPVVAPHPPAGFPMVVPSKPSLPVIRTVDTPYGKLTGDVTADTTTIFPAGTIVSIFSPFNNKYLNIVDKSAAITSPNVIELADAVLECTGTDPVKDPKCQWIVRSPNSHERSVRLDNVGYDELYLREFIAPDKRVIFQPGLGIEWGDMWSTTVNFLAPKDPSIGGNTKDVFILGAQVADLKLRQTPSGPITLNASTKYLLGTTKEGSLIDADNVSIAPNSMWRIRIIGNLDGAGKPQIKEQA